MLREAELRGRLCCVSAPEGRLIPGGIFAACWIPPPLSLRERRGAPRDVSGVPGLC